MVLQDRYTLHLFYEFSQTERASISYKNNVQ